MDEQRTRALEGWFRQHARDLPWRRRRTGYTALVAEAMLQQTQVARVLERYEAFLRRFPSVAALARADEQEVLAAWQGLGYYRRARRLHEAARMLVRERGGRVPRTAAGLRTLPGVGRYTAGAIASIVYGQREPIVDGNVERVLARWHARRDPPGTSRAVAWAWARAEALVAAADEPGPLNEALMELGATVCTPKSPRCGRCPVAALCRARERGNPEAFPPPRPAAPRRRVHHHAVVIRRGDAMLLEQRPADGLWSRLWQAPTIEAARALAPAEIEAALPVRVQGLRRTGRFRHQTTHRLIEFHVLTARSRARRGVYGAGRTISRIYR